MYVYLCGASESISTHTHMKADACVCPCPYYNALLITMNDDADDDNCEGSTGMGRGTAR